MEENCLGCLSIKHVFLILTLSVIFFSLPIPPLYRARSALASARDTSSSRSTTSASSKTRRVRKPRWREKTKLGRKRKRNETQKKEQQINKQIVTHDVRASFRSCLL